MNFAGLLTYSELEINGERLPLKRVALGPIRSASATIVITDAYEWFEADEVGDVPVFEFAPQAGLEVTAVIALLADEAPVTVALTVGDVKSAIEWKRLHRRSGVEQNVLSDGGAVIAFALERHDQVLEVQRDLDRLSGIVEQALENGPFNVDDICVTPARADAYACWGDLRDDGTLDALLVDFDPFRR